MKEGTKLGKIQKAWFGYGGYQEHELGIWFVLGGENWGVATGRGMWKGERHNTAKWTEEDRQKVWGEICSYVDGLLSDAKVDRVENLVGAPVAVTFEASLLKEFRILKEVL